MTNKVQHPPTIELDGARLRPLRMADADALHAYLRDPAVTELTAYPVVSTPMVEGMIERSINRWAAGELSKWAVALQHDDQIVGTCGFNEWSQVHRWAELAYDLAQPHWGKGLMRQAVAAAIQWAFGQDHVNRVHAFVRVDNRRSQGLLERSGFVREGCLRSYRVCRGQPHDYYIYGLLRSDWAAAQTHAARRYAEEKHQGQRYGDHPYTMHLAAVREVLRGAGFEDGHPLATASWLHDVIEDTGATREDVAARFGDEVAALVWAVTGVGKNRRERNASAYAKIRACPDAATLKLADRIANVEASADVPDKLTMYRKEWPAFRDALQGLGTPALWDRLRTALGVSS